MNDSQGGDHGGHSHGGHSHGGHSHGGHSHGGTRPEAEKTPHPGHGVAVSRGFVEARRTNAQQADTLPAGFGRGKTLFFDMPSGVSGDMILAGLVDLGVPVSVIENAVAALGLHQVRLDVRHGYVGAIGTTHVRVLFDEETIERSYRDIEALISGSSLAARVKELSLKIFRRLGEAEAQVHQTSLNEVHFHEVGAVDSIVDIVGAAAGLDFVGATVKASPVPLGRGFVECRHGTLPLPAPATLGCLVGVPTVDSGLSVELVTPTGAAIVASVATEFGEWFPLVPERVGWGAGTRGLLDRPNALRLILGAESAFGGTFDTHVLLEANIDDMTGESAAHALRKVLEAGALDVWIVPATMKKGRPAMVFCALAEKASRTQVVTAILSETSTIGVRQSLVGRVELARESTMVQTRFGDVRVKVSGGPGIGIKKKPEIEDCIALAESQRVPLREVISEVTRAIAADDEAGN